MPHPLDPRRFRAYWRRREILDLYTFPVHGPGPAADTSRSLEDATAEVLDLMREAYPKDFNARKHQLLLDRLTHPADRTLIIRDEHGEACGYCHITDENTENARIRLPIKVSARQAYLWDDQVFARHRRRGLHAFSIARRLELLAEQGRTEALTIISRPNEASRRSYGAFGLRRRRVLIYLPALKRTFSVPATRTVPD
ncbi:GNAT family N-acetyltransferase [Ornithinimicrobium cavernae]|uniref:GNAT family N-acetyltransferase n=1 Tax=Ornithinimicrobium cavernae TaxID=2666047 RepID=UPI000D69FC20|nr:GNAT family N-acetyltransferase [Ornithinimicrobium cavernae]